MDSELKRLDILLPGFIIQNRASSTAKKHFESLRSGKNGPKIKAWNFSLHPQQDSVCTLPKFVCQSCQSLLAFVFTINGVAWEHKKAVLSSPAENSLGKQIVDASKRILDAKHRYRKMPLEKHYIRSLVDRYRRSDLSNLQITCLITLGFAGFFRWDNLSQLLAFD